MAVNLSPVGGVAGQFFDNNGDPLVGGKLYTYAAGTTTPQTTYTNSLGTTANSNPIILNGGGRVPSEIWLTDSASYKFVLYSSTDQLIGSWDDISGINSNFVNFTSSQEIQTATSGQTVFTLTTMTYQPGTNSLTVYVDGVNQYGPGALYAYTETDDTTVTFNTGLHVGAEVKFTTIQQATSSATDASQVAYQPAGSGAVATNVQAKLRETVSVKDFGAVGDGVADDTAAFNNCPDGLIYIPEGTYILSGFIPKDNTTYLGTNNTFLKLGSTTASICELANGAKNITFSGLNFIGNAASSKSACQIFDSNAAPYENNITWENCSFSTFGGTAITGGGLKKAVISNCSFTKTAQLNDPSGTTSYPAIWLSDSGVSWAASSDILIDNCQFYDLFWSAIYALGTRIIVSNNKIQKTKESCIFISSVASYVTVSNNIIDTTEIQNISASGVEIAGNYCNVSGNTINNCELYGISIQDCVHFSATGNIVEDCQTGIALITSSATTPPRYGTVTGNTVSRSLYGIRFFKSGSGAEIQDCYVAGNSSVLSTGSPEDVNTTDPIVAANTVFRDNSNDSRFPSMNNIAFAALGTGSQVLFSLSFKPSLIEFQAAHISDILGPRSSYGAVTFSSGSPFEKCISLTDGGGARIATGRSIIIYNTAFAAPLLSVTITGVTYNTSTKNWDVVGNIVTNTGDNVWAVYTATP